MTAREMFERLGYRCIKSNNSIWYINDSDEENYRSVEFYFCDCTFDAIGNYGDPLMVNVKELEAINKQCEELGWIEKEEKTETNYEHFKNKIIEDCSFTLALVDGKPQKCSSVNCNGCGFSTGHGCREKIKEWLKSPYEKPTCKLTKFEYDLLNAHKDSGMRQCISNYSTLLEMYGKGHFKGIDTSVPIHKILENCEVMD